MSQASLGELTTLSQDRPHIAGIKMTYTFKGRGEKQGGDERTERGRQSTGKQGKRREGTF